VGASQARLLGHTDQVWARLSREIRTVVAARAHRAAEAAASLGKAAPAGASPAVVVRADSSLAAQAAGRLADVARIEALDAQDARTLRREIRRAAVEAGRDPDDVKVLIDVVALVSHDAAAARARRDLLGDLSTGEPAWVRTLSHLGSTAQLTDLLEAWVSDEVVDGFTILPGSLPHDLRALVGEVVPQLQQRGLVRASYGQSPATP
jgi:alkanesulfonate monooxygenase SsuD/methylene tetrahydromethanopterin reductase-like flavin-dependent oxidoreductase (luciferase family)